MGSGGEVFSFTPSGGFVPSSQVTVDAQTEILSLTQLRISGTSRVLSLVLSFGRCREKGVDCWLWCGGGGGQGFPEPAKSSSFPSSPLPDGDAAAPARQSWCHYCLSVSTDQMPDSVSGT